jgi:hypothetical protein
MFNTLDRGSGTKGYDVVAYVTEARPVHGHTLSSAAMYDDVSIARETRWHRYQTAPH